jgi:hypothetical protein
MNEQQSIGAECQLLSRWFPQLFPFVLLRAIEQGTLHCGFFVDPDHDGCGDPYGHLLGLPEHWQEAAQLAQGVRAALGRESEDMTPLQRWVAPVRPGQTHVSSQRLSLLYHDILPSYLTAASNTVHSLQEAENTMSIRFTQRKLNGESLPLRWSLLRDIILARKASEYIESEWNNRKMEDSIRWVIQDALQEFAFQRGLHQSDRFLFGVPHDQMKALLKNVSHLVTQKEQQLAADASIRANVQREFHRALRNYHEMMQAYAEEGREKLEGRGSHQENEAAACFAAHALGRVLGFSETYMSNLLNLLEFGHEPDLYTRLVAWFNEPNPGPFESLHIPEHFNAL